MVRPVQLARSVRAFKTRTGSRPSAATASGAFPNPTTQIGFGPIRKAARVFIYNRVTQDGIFAQPYIQNSIESFDNRVAKYRFNWESPIAFAPWDPHVGWVGGNAIFQTTDRGRHWTAISPDLTRNVKDHQQPSGGPITHDVSSAEESDTLLDIEGSTIAKGEIWAGTDDGLVQLDARLRKALEKRDAAGRPRVRPLRYRRAVAARRRNRVRDQRRPLRRRLRTARVRHEGFRRALDVDRQRAAGRTMDPRDPPGYSQQEHRLSRQRGRDVRLVRRRGRSGSRSKTGCRRRRFTTFGCSRKPTICWLRRTGARCTSWTT